MLDRRRLRRVKRLARTARHRVDPGNWAAGLWAWRALDVARRDLPTVGIKARVPRAPALPDRGLHAVEAVLRRRRATCLERCLVVQEWLLVHGSRHDVVIGVPRPGESFQAHAWLSDWTFDPQSVEYQELTRLAPRAVS